MKYILIEGDLEPLLGLRKRIESNKHVIAVKINDSGFVVKRRYPDADTASYVFSNLLSHVNNPSNDVIDFDTIVRAAESFLLNSKPFR